MWKRYIPLILCIIYTGFYFLPVSTDVGIWLSILTHAFAFPTIWSDWPKFLSIATLLTIIASSLFHILKDGYNLDDEKEFRRFDHGLSVFLMYAVVFKVAYKQIPYWAVLVLIVVTAIPIAFLTNPRTYLFLAIIAYLIMAVLLFLKFNRDLLLSFVLLLVASSSRYWPILNQNKYHRHSIWHALVFTAVFYAHCGILTVRKKEEQQEQKSNENIVKMKIIAYKDQLKF